MPERTDDEIRKRAYELWEKAGSPEGEMDRFWYEAELELNLDERGGDQPAQDRLE